MDNNIPPAPPVPAPIEVGPAPAPVPAPVPMPIAAPVPPPTGGGFSDLMSGINFSDVAIFALVTVALVSSTYYYVSMIKAVKTWRAKQQDDIDELKSNVKASMGPDYQNFS